MKYSGAAKTSQRHRIDKGGIKICGKIWWSEKLSVTLQRQKRKRRLSLDFDRLTGALAHLARAFDWQSRGDQFESGMLHQIFNNSQRIGNQFKRPIANVV